MLNIEIIEKNIIEIEIIEKFNPYHDRKGKFTTPGLANSFTIGNKSGLAWNQKNVYRAKEREKQRTETHERYKESLAWYKREIDDAVKHQRQYKQKGDISGYVYAKSKKERLQGQYNALKEEYKKVAAEIDNTPLF